MPDVRPLRAISFDPTRAGADIAKLVAEPYDKVTDAMRAAYLTTAPHNIVAVDLPRDGDDRYAAAASRFRAWLRDGVLRKAERPAFYLYEQEYDVYGGRLTRRAILGLVEAAPYGRGGVVPHERTFGEPKADRLALLKASRAHFGMVFLLYQDPEREALRAVERAIDRGSPLFDFRLPVDGIGHRVYAATDARAIEAVRAAIGPRTCVIADGHHRYETALAFRRETEAAGETGPGPRYRLAALVNSEEGGAGGLTILPTHRLTPPVPVLPLSPGEGRGEGAASTADLSGTAAPYFDVSDIPAGADLVEVLTALASDPEPFGQFAVAGPGGRFWRLRLKAGVDLDRELASLAPVVRRLDVAILHGLWLDRAFGHGQGHVHGVGHGHGHGQGLGYVRDPGEGLAAVEAGKYAAMVLVRPTQVDQVIEVARQGAVMPQKSTDFYPKLLSGLVMNDVEDDVYGIPSRAAR